MTNETFPTINGTEKQVAWANDLRNKAIKDFDEFRAGKKDDSRFDIYRTWLANHTDAKWWIDNRRDIYGEADLVALMCSLVVMGEFRKECNF